MGTLNTQPKEVLPQPPCVQQQSTLTGIRAELAELGLADVEIRTAVRTGDTPQKERQRGLRRPPHILVTTPESLYVLLGSASGRTLLSTVRTVILDEIHALAPNKRGSHLALSLERLQALCVRPVTRIGLSATQKPLAEVARFLVGAGATADGIADCAIVDIGYARQRDLGLELPPTPLSAVMSNDQWTEVYARVAELVAAHRTTLVFVNTRRMAERAARHLGDLLGREAVAAHHGSLAKEARLDAEQRLKRGALKVLVATASLELGLDIGDVDLVCQLGSPRSIATFLQRAGRAGHAVGGTPKARLFPQSRDDLVECTALLDAVRRGELDVLRVLPAPLDVLAQQIVAETACQEWGEDELFQLLRRAWPYAMLTREAYGAVVRMLAEGFGTRHGVRGVLLHRDLVHQRLRGHRGGRLTALTSGGTIPDTGDYSVLLEPQADTIGSVNEDFAVESSAGDIFQLGNTSYRILRVEPGRVRVEDAHGAPPNIPFWLGEAPGRSDELSFAVSRLRTDIEQQLHAGGAQAAIGMLIAEMGLDAEAAQQVVEYLARTLSALGALPTQSCVVMERFFDASGGMQLIIHSPFGSRINRAWGLALRKRFCRQFNVELQAAATEDAIVLSLSTSHSFPLDEVARYLRSATALGVLVQALLDAPLFGVRWRWNATTALALPRFVSGRKTAPQLQRMKAEDLMAAIFPDQVACAENLVGEREVPEHPLVAQTLDDCLHDAMDASGWLSLLRRIEAGEVQVLARDLPGPSPLAAEALGARPFAYLDDAPLEERRAQAVQSRDYGGSDGVDGLGQLDAAAIASVREEAWPTARSPDEMHEALMALGVITDAEAAAAPGWSAWLAALAAAGRATRLSCEPAAEGEAGDEGREAGSDAAASGGLWIAAERLSPSQLVYPSALMQPRIDAPVGSEPRPEDFDTALADLLRARLGGLGPVSLAALAAQLRLPAAPIQRALAALQAEGSVLQGQFSPNATAVEWCERHLLARIHRYTLKRLRREIEPVEAVDFARFLFDWQHLSEATQVSGPEALPGVLAQLEGFEAPAALWEAELLPARVQDYAPHWLDELCTAGRIMWTRLRPAAVDAQGGGRGSLRSTPIVLLPRRSAMVWSGLAASASNPGGLSLRAIDVVTFLEQHGASFFDELSEGCRLLRTELEDALAELVVRGRIHCDSFAGLRALMVPAARRSAHAARLRRRVALSGIADAGRWTPVRATQPVAEAAEHLVRTLLLRYGVVCWRLLEREAVWLPPWRQLVRVLRRLEARGEVRGGRFIAGLTGEQFALPEAIPLLRSIRRQPGDGSLICLAAADPANLLGVLLPGARVPRTSGSRVLYLDGLPIATCVAGHIDLLVPLDPQRQREAEHLLMLDPGRRHFEQQSRIATGNAVASVADAVVPAPRP